MMMKKLNKFILLGILVSPSLCFGDYGEAFLSIRCDTPNNFFELQPLIFWNEDLEAIKRDTKFQNGAFESDDLLLIKMEQSKKISQTCSLDREVKITIPGYWRKINLFENDELVLSFTGDRVWTSYGWLFKLRYTTKSGWEEMCGSDDDTNSWQPLNRQ